MAVERLDRRIAVEGPRLGEQRLHAKREMTPQPGGAIRLVDRLEGPPDRVLADDLLHPQKFRKHRVASQRSNMRVAPVAGQHRQHRRAENVSFARRVRAHVAQRTVGYEGVERTGRLDEVDEERQLPKRRHCRFVVPFNPDRTKETVEIDPSRPLPPDNQGLLTRQVS